MSDVASPLLTDLYQLNMIEAYLDHGQTQTAVFEFFVRKLPSRRGFLVAVGLEQALDFLEGLRSRPKKSIGWSRQVALTEISWITSRAFALPAKFTQCPRALFSLRTSQFLRVTAPLPEAQLAETRLINILHFQSLIASKAARIVLAAPGKLLVDFGLRRAHGAEAGLLAARASYIAGFAGTATMLAEKLYGIPTFGTMAHSFIQAYDDREPGV